MKGSPTHTESSDALPDEIPSKISRRALLLAAPTAAGAAAVAFVLVSEPGSDSVKTAEATEATTTTTPPTTTNELPGELFSSAEVTTETAPSTSRAPTTTSTTTTSTTTTTTAVPDTLPEQPDQPIAPPPDPRGYEDQIQLGGISIPKLELDAPLLEGIRLTTLDNGPGHWPGTAMPGDVGNVVVAAHRTSHGAPFRHIDTLVAGDIVNFTVNGELIEYTVTGTQIVNPDAIWIVDPTDTPTATLFACHPPGSVSKRIVVNLELSE